MDVHYYCLGFLGGQIILLEVGRVFVFDLVPALMVLYVIRLMSRQAFCIEHRSRG